MEKKFIYGVQWIDHGGPYDESSWDEHISTALEKMGFDTSIILDCGGVKYTESNPNTIGYFGYITTNTALPSWNGFEENRFVEKIRLWFYTFELDEKRIEEFYTLSDFDEIYWA